MQDPELCSPIAASGRVLAHLGVSSIKSSFRSKSLRVPDANDWTIMYDDVERLYVRERRKLRYLMNFVETKYGVRATEQMFKKRLSRWGFQKSNKRSSKSLLPSNSQRPCRSAPNGRRSYHGSHLSMSRLFSTCNADDCNLAVLTSVRDWAAGFFETVLTPEWLAHSSHDQVEKDVLDLERSTEVGRAFKLVARLMSKGYGTLAGRTARKAFLLLEEMFSLDGPALTWNLLAIMYDLAVAQHTQLLEMLLAHVLSLTQRKIHGNHPMLALLTSLQRYTLHRHSSHLVAGSGTTTPSESSSPSTATASSGNEEAAMTNESTYEANAMSFLLERAWTFNAEILFGHLDVRLTRIYCRLDLDSSALTLPSHTLDLANQWINRMETESTFNAAKVGENREFCISSLGPGKDTFLGVGNESGVSTWSLEVYEQIRENSYAQVRRQLRETACREQIDADSNVVVQIRILGGLMAELVPGSLGSVLVPSATGSFQLSSAHVGHLSYIIRASKDLDCLRSDGLQRSAADNIRLMRLIVDLCEYAYGRTSLRVVQEMLLLQDACSAAGDTKEAMKIEKDVVSRLKQYTYELSSEIIDKRTQGAIQ